MVDPKLIVINNSILIDVSHAKRKGDEKLINGFVVGKIEQSEVPSWGKVLAVPDGDPTIEVGDIIGIAGGGLLRVVDYPGQSPDTRVAIIRRENIDFVVKA